MSKTYQPSESTIRTLTVHDLATILKKSHRTICNDVYRAPHRLPPRLNFGEKGPLLWRYETVIAWLEAHEEQAVINGGSK